MPLSFWPITLTPSVMQEWKRSGSKLYQTVPRNYKVTAIEPRYSHAYQLGTTENEVSGGAIAIYMKPVKKRLIVQAITRSQALQMNMLGPKQTGKQMHMHCSSTTAQMWVHGL